MVNRIHRVAERGRRVKAKVDLLSIIAQYGTNDSNTAPSPSPARSGRARADPEIPGRGSGKPRGTGAESESDTGGWGSGARALGPAVERRPSTELRAEAQSTVGDKAATLKRLVLAHSDTTHGIWRAIQRQGSIRRGKHVLRVARDDLGQALLDVCRADARALMRGNVTIEFGNNERGADYGGLPPTQSHTPNPTLPVRSL